MEPLLFIFKVWIHWLRHHQRLGGASALIVIGILIWTLIQIAASRQKAQEPVITPTPEPTLQPKPLELETAASWYGLSWQPYAKVAITDGIWDCASITYQSIGDGSDLTEAILTNADRTTWAMVSLKGHMTCDELQGIQAVGQPSEFNSFLLWPLKDKDYFAPYVNVENRVKICTYCEPESVGAMLADYSVKAEEDKKADAQVEALCGVALLCIMALVTLFVAYSDY